MPTRSRLMTKDEELGKRDDDFKPARNRNPSIPTILPWRWRKKRILAALTAIAFIYVFIQNMSIDSAEVDQGAEWQSGREPPVVEGGSPARGGTQRGYDSYKAVVDQEPTGPPPRDDSSTTDDAADRHYYNGVVRFYKLAKSLHKVARTTGHMLQNPNVLFAASSTKSLANLLPMACEMARLRANYAHIALFGRSTLPLEDLISINGVTDEDCPVYWHDARGDYAEFSSDARAESATRGAMRHINDFLQPRAVIMDDKSKEDAFFVTAMKSKARDIGKPLIQIPSGHYEQFLWLTRLDADSLAAWDNPSFEILIHAPNDSSGRLIRLLQSLYNADYSGLKVPKLTIELPSKVEHFLESYLAGFQWPPGRTFSEPSLLTIRHRIPNSRASSEEAAMRFVESFYPSHKHDEHVLVLSPQAEVSPVYLQYLHLLILNYHYNWGSPGSEDLLGFSLDVPSAKLDGKGVFEQPKVGDMIRTKYDDDDQVDTQAPSSFVYQAASSTASLFLGYRWAEFHDFLAKRIQASHSGKISKRRKKLVAETEPAWVEYLLELMRARGWTVLHPANSFVTIHNELAQVPEEYSRPPKSNTKATQAFKSSRRPEEEPFLLSREPPVLSEHTEADPTRNLLPLHRMLQSNGDLPNVAHLPVIGHDGELLTLEELTERQQDYVPEFRGTTGGCQGADATRRRFAMLGKVDDLFCLPGVDMQFADEESETDEWDEPTNFADDEAPDDDLTMPPPRDIPKLKAPTVETPEEMRAKLKQDDVG